MNDEIKVDICKIIECFDNFLDDMYDRGAFNPNDETDGEIDIFVNEMKEKYLNK